MDYNSLNRRGKPGKTTAQNSKVKIQRATGQIADLLATEGFMMGKVLAIQSNIQKIVPAYRREPDHILVIMKEFGEFLNEIEPSFKDWHKEGDKSEQDINWQHAAEELADVLILQARALVDDPDYGVNVQAMYMRSDLMDASAYTIGSDATLGQVALASLLPFYTPTSDYSEKVASMYYTAQLASMMPFGIIGLQEAWVNKVIKVIRRVYK
jgi:hypothetical protein